MDQPGGSIHQAVAIHLPPAMEQLGSTSQMDQPGGPAGLGEPAEPAGPVRCSVFGVRCSVFGVRCSVFGVRCSLAFGASGFQI